jgi:hypothetical protein
MTLRHLAFDGKINDSPKPISETAKRIKFCFCQLGQRVHRRGSELIL